MRVLVTRPQPDASHTAAKLEARGHRAIVDPVLTIEVLSTKEISATAFDAVAVTSANAVRAVVATPQSESLSGLPVYAVGSHSAEAARQAGFAHVHDADGDAVALAELISRSLRPGARVLHLAGEERARDLGELLAAAQIAVEVSVLYRMRTAEAFGLAADALAAGNLDAALHFSSRSAASFVMLAERHGLTGAARALRHLCLSAAVAVPLAGIGARTEVAAHPREETLLDMLDS